MAEDVARAVGAEGTESIVIAGKQCTVRGLGARELTEVERYCVKDFKRNYLESYKENIDLLTDDKEEQKRLLQEKLDESSKWDVDDLGVKYAIDPSTIRVTKELRKWLKENIGYSDKDSNGEKLGGDQLDTKLQRIAAMAIDSGMLNEDEYEELTGSKFRKTKVGYVQWWITGAFEGMVTMVYVCFKHNGVTRDQVIDALSNDLGTLANTAREIEHLSAVSSGNG